MATKLPAVKPTHNWGLFMAAILVAVGGLIYELIIGTVSAYLLGNSVLHFSVTIGLFLCGMGVGAALSPYLTKRSSDLFIGNEVLLGLIGGNSVVLLFGLFTFLPALFYVGLVIIVVGIGALIGLEIPLLLRMLEGKHHSHQVLTRVLSLDYLGSLLASLVFPLLLLPYLGLLRTSFLIGVINVGLAGLVFWLLPTAGRPRSKLLMAGIVVSLMILISEALGANVIAAYFDYKLYQDEVVYSQQTKYQKIVITKFKDDVRLFLDGNLQFSTLDEHRYHEALVHVPISYLASNRPQQVLVLGGGDGLAVRELLKYETVQQVTLVDLDPAMTALAKEHSLLLAQNNNSLQNSKVTLITSDAMNYLQEKISLFDLIIIDLPDPNSENLAKLYSQEFYQLVAQHLSEDGIVVTQATSPYFSHRTFWMINQTLQEAGLVTKPYHLNVPSFGEWGFVMASHHTVFSAEPQPIRVSTRFLSNEVIPTLLVFDQDMQPQSNQTEVSTLFNPIILQAYQEDYKRWKQ